MRLLKWSPDFDVREESPIPPMWIAFPNLRLHFFYTQILFGLASVFSRPLQTDQATTSLSRPFVARVLVELDVTKKQPHEIWLGSKLNGYFQKVEIENLPIFCSHCKMHGHAINECFYLHPNLCKEKGTLKSNANVVNENLTLVQNEVGNDSGMMDMGVHNCDHVGEVSLAKESEENLITNASITNVRIPILNTSDPIINKNGNNAHEFSSNLANDLSPMVVQEDGCALRNPALLEQDKWQNAVSVNRSDNIVIVLDLGDVESSRSHDNNNIIDHELVGIDLLIMVNPIMLRFVVIVWKGTSLRLKMVYFIWKVVSLL
ncbi:hypothetical protein MA16_Dca014828 [Dendrobium catenatum]|uniref:Uncharacterized protein n=1 Tax=Dendrobium catenatum TaxID=906689 RepID=A0A2I0XB44_9ASPA|nr:hypothetical protein MA16_Dca014828 [Dendrobium catenatum]